LNPDVRYRQGDIKLLLDNPSLSRPNKQQQTFMIPMESPHIIGMLMSPRECII
jgi:hypothetical protein